jgi:hypothetical protein
MCVLGMSITLAYLLLANTLTRRRRSFFLSMQWFYKDIYICSLTVRRRGSRWDSGMDWGGALAGNEHIFYPNESRGASRD